MCHPDPEVAFFRGLRRRDLLFRPQICSGGACHALRLRSPRVVRRFPAASLFFSFRSAGLPPHGASLFTLSLEGPPFFFFSVASVIFSLCSAPAPTRSGC